MQREDHHLADPRWLTHCAERLRQEWPRADDTQLNEAALEIWQDDGFQAMPGSEAAAIWLWLLRRT